MTTMHSSVNVAAQIKTDIGHAFADAIELAYEGTSYFSGNNFKTSSAGWAMWEKVTLRIIRSALEDDPNTTRRSIAAAPLLDLGCGDKPEQVAMWAKEWGASAYLGIDLFQRTRKLPELGDFPAFMLGGIDMLAYLKNLPPRVCSLTINAIDDAVIREVSYHHALSTELIRICRVGGAIFGVCANSLAPLENGFSDLTSWIHQDGVIRSIGKKHNTGNQIDNCAGGFYVKCESVTARGGICGSQFQ